MPRLFAPAAGAHASSNTPGANDFARLALRIPPLRHTNLRKPHMTVLRLSPYVPGLFVQLDPTDARLHPDARPALQAVLDCFDAVERVAADEHRARVVGDDDLNELAANVSAWGDVLDLLAATTRALAGVSQLVPLWSSVAARKGFAERQKAAHTADVMRDAMAQHVAMQRAVMLHRSRDPLAPADNVVHSLEMADSSAESLAMLRAAR